MLRKLRAALIISALWTLCWVPVGRALEDALVGILLPQPRIDSPYMGMTTWIIWGALSGLGFAIVLGLLERGRGVATLSTFRVLSWGAVGSVILPIVYTVYFLAQPALALSLDLTFWLIVLLPIGVSALLGTLCAGITLALVRAGAAREPSRSSGAA